MLQLLKQSSEVDQLTMLQNQVESVKGIMASSLDKMFTRAEQLEMQEDEFSRTSHYLRNKPSCNIKHCIVIALCFPCVLIAKCYNRRQHRNELQGYAELPGDVVNATSIGTNALVYIIMCMKSYL